ncbi:polya polymerase [Blautia marasmi]|uniref:polya polymerase n=1 Tax=Blautia marasmi TaxID=1917868 RepID=UPI000CF1C7A2|nr:polya polymerase [Blautia marasmi]
MKLTNIENPKGLMEVIDTCEGTVEIVTSEGDRLNLKSKLCQYISLASIFTVASKIPELEIIAHEPDDLNKILKYIMKE